MREEMEHVREGKHGARSIKQAIAIGLSKARRTGVKLLARGQSARTQRKAKQDIKRSHTGRRKPSSQALARDQIGSETRRPPRTVIASARAAGEERIAPPLEEIAQRSRQESREHTRAPAKITVAQSSR